MKIAPSCSKKESHEYKSNRQDIISRYHTCSDVLLYLCARSSTSGIIMIKTEIEVKFNQPLPKLLRSA